MIRRISLWGSPGGGKSTTVSWLFSQLKIANYNIEYINEYAKRWAFQKRPIIGFDQMFLTAQQINNEDEYLRNGIDLTITDSPVLIGYVYGKRNGVTHIETVRQMGRAIEKDYKSLNIFLIRDTPYQGQGRYENEKEADEAAKLMLDFLHEEYGEVPMFHTTKQKEILEFLRNTLGSPASRLL
jgi:hypothetical protein